MMYPLEFDNIFSSGHIQKLHHYKTNVKKTFRAQSKLYDALRIVLYVQKCVLSVANALKVQ